MSNLKIALAGNPNCGKTTVFNALTGSKQQVGNWPGVTVERVIGQYVHCEAAIDVTDLPGIYSFSALSPDEEVARKHILFDTPDVVVNVVDASNLERNLYLTTQLLEMDVPVIVALNMMDMATQRGIRIEVEHLAKHLGCPVIPVVASKKKGIEELKKEICAISKSHLKPGVRVAYEKDIEKVLQSMEISLGDVALTKRVSPRWLAIKLLEKDDLAFEIIGADKAQLPDLDHQLRKVERIVGEDADMIIADGRYGFIHGLARDVTAGSDKMRKTFSDAVDKFVLNKVLGFPIFFGVMYLVFAITINIGGPFIDFFDGFCGTIFVDGFGHLLETIHTPAWAVAILAEGLGGGIQTVSTFIPPIFFIFFCLSFLEDSGYMSRAAFVMDHFLRTIGLPGKAFIPMLVGFGCNVPGIMATRTLESRRERILAIMMNPFMSCGARLPVYTLFAAAFFPQSGGVVIFGIYLIGIALAVMTGLLFKKTLLRGEVTSFVMELPPYHMPTLSGVMYHTWHRLKSFLIKAGQVILLIVAVLGFLNSMGTDGSFGNNDSKDSVLSAMSRAVTPVFRPMGIEDENWPATVGLFTGIFAKEAVVGTLDSIYSQIETADEIAAEQAEAVFEFWPGIISAIAAIPAGYEGFFDTLKDPLGLSRALVEVDEADQSSYATMVSRFGEHGPKAAFAYLLFILIYAPCVAALAAIAREIGMGWMLFAVSYLTILAWVVSTIYFQLATFTEHPSASAGWLGLCGAILVTFYIGLRMAGDKGAEQHA
ncbi:Fe(2+) transporter permease subunit FeoB [Pontiella sulfatireligans]|uniref:Ferrous iron transport protein B n=1 Tax=Pontiella sulfatireligans TaxID=2750658 RepID=A0A6C2UR92_9BACT|nr:Fe(2+) transporter permease subunit FeoB [Pontiella sulfatireligans]VGO21771.1 Fe(2+) transporter FeoB [Pontiella sulfatireligans]